MELAVVKVYGRALYEAAGELDMIDDIKSETEQINSIFREEEEFYQLLINPSVSCANKKQMLENVFEGRISEPSLSFLYILADKGRLHYYEEIYREFDRLVRDGEGIDEGTVYSAQPLTTEQISKLEVETGKLLAKRIKLKNEIDSEIIGGVKIMASDKMIDASIRSGLNRLLSQLKEL